MTARMRGHSFLVVVAMSVLLTTVAVAQDTTEVARLRAEIATLREKFEASQEEFDSSLAALNDSMRIGRPGTTRFLVSGYAVGEYRTVRNGPSSSRPKSHPSCSGS